MPFPPIRHCLVCESVRVEERGKVTLLGFYGIAPDVIILLPNFQTPFAQLGFFLLGGQGQGNFNVSARLADEAGVVVLETPAAPVTINPPANEMYINLNIQLIGVPFPRAGTYRFSLFVDGAEHFWATFQLRQQTPVVPAAPGPPQ
jgi:uncharacterized protein DUF6941